MFEPPGNGAALHHVGAFERHIKHSALFHLAPVPGAADRNVQAEVLDPHRLAGARFAVPDADLADGEKMVHEPDLLAARAQVGEFGAAQDATVVLRSLVGRLRAVVGPVGRLVDQRVEGLDGAAGGEPVGCVALVGEAGQLEEADARRLAGERAGHVLRMIAAGLVVVGDDDHIGAGEVLGKGRVPLAGTAWIAGRGDAVAGERQNVLLALDDEHAPFQRERLDQLGQAVRHLPHALDAPHPAVLHLVRRIVRACPAPLAKGFRVEPADLEQQRAEFVGVVVGRDDLELLRAVVVCVAVAVLAQPFPRNSPTRSRLRKSSTPPPSLASWSNHVPLATSTLRAPLVPQRNSFLLEWRGFGSPQKCRATSGMASGELGAAVMTPPAPEARDSMPAIAHPRAPSADRQWSHP